MGGDWVWLGNQLLPQYLLADAPPAVNTICNFLIWPYFPGTAVP